MIRSCAVALCGVLLLAGCSSSSPAPIACAAPSSICGSASKAAFCANLITDSSNCGSCGTVCAVPGNGGTTSCSAGTCAPSCGGGSKALCNAAGKAGAGLPALSCTDTATDVDNCGACGKVCPANQACTSGACVASTLTACGGSTGGQTFKDLQADHENCGACGNACGATESCVAGDCNACPVGQCGNVCTDTQSDSANCGTCGSIVNICENGAGVPAAGTSKISIEIAAPASTGFLPSSGTVTQLVKVHSQSRVQSVTVQVGTQAEVAMTLASATSSAPSIWTAAVTVPTAGSTRLTFVAKDELWLAGRSDSTDHISTISTALSILPVPTTAPTQLAATLLGGPLQGMWVPLNAGPISLSATTAQANIASIEFLNNGNLVGTSASGQPLVLAPAQVGTGAASVVACAIDVVGQTSPCSPAITLTIGLIPVPNLAGGLATSPPVLGKAADGSHAIFFFANSGNASGFLYGQPFDQVNPTPAAPGTRIGSDSFVLSSMVPTPEGTGVYALKSDGTAVERFDCGTAACAKPLYAVPPTGTVFATIPIITSAAMMLLDANGGTFLAQAQGSSQPTVNTAVDAGGPSPLRGQTQSGAIVAWVTSASGAALYLFHPTITSPANHLFPLVPLRPSTTPTDLKVFPGGEVVFQYTDSGTGQLYLGAALFDGIHPPVTLAPFPIGLIKSSPAVNFMVAKPGVILGEVPASTVNQLEAIELSLSAGSQKSFLPAPFISAAMGTGPFCNRCVEDRFANSSDFSVSDDGSKAIFVTTDSDANGPLRNIHLLDLAVGTAPVLGGSSLLLNNQRLPRFVHTAAVYSGGPATGMVPAVVWAEQLNNAPSTSFSFFDERLLFATWSASGAGPAITVDRTAGYFTSAGSSSDSVAESASAQQIFFLAQRGGGGADLYSVSLTGTSGAATKVVDRVYWYAVREDRARMLVARADGTLLYAKLTPGVNLASALQPILEGGPMGDSGDYATNLSSFGFTPDGDHAFAAVDQTYSALATPSANFYRGLLETIDLTSGARTNFGRTVWGQQGFNALFLDHAKSAFLADNFAIQESPARLAFAAAATGTVHRDTNLFPTGFQPSAQFLYFLAGDLTEALLAVNRSGGRAPNTGGIAQEDGTFLSLGGGLSASALQFGEQFPPPLGGVSRFGPGQDNIPLLIDWAVLGRTTTSGTPGSVLKVFGGGASPAPLVQVSSGFQAFNNFTATRQTPDNKELLYSFRNPADANSGYLIALPLSGQAPAPALVP